MKERRTYRQAELLWQRRALISVVFCYIISIIWRTHTPSLRHSGINSLGVLCHDALQQMMNVTENANQHDLPGLDKPRFLRRSFFRFLGFLNF